MERTNLLGSELSNHSCLGILTEPSVKHAVPLRMQDFMMSLKHGLSLVGLCSASIRQEFNEPRAYANRCNLEKYSASVLISVISCDSKCPPNEFSSVLRGQVTCKSHSGPSLLGPTHRGASCTYRQVLWGESAQTRQVPPGGSVELLHLLRELLLEAPLLFVLLSVSELHHDR